MMNKEFKDWLEEKKRVSTYSYLNNGKLIIPSHDIEKELDLVIKKYDELHKPAVIPQYVADFIEEVKASGDRLDDAFSILRGIYHQSKAAEWVTKEKRNSETFARAWLDGYEVEEEQKYYVDLDTAAYVARWNGDDQVDIYTADISGSDEFEFHLTEQEIKNYDERFWPFAELVE